MTCEIFPLDHGACLEALLQDIQIGQQKVGNRWTSFSIREHLYGFKCDVPQSYYEQASTKSITSFVGVLQFFAWCPDFDRNILGYGIQRVLVTFVPCFFFFRQTTLTGKCGKRARPDVLYEGSAEEDDDDDGETVTISCHYDIMG